MISEEIILSKDRAVCLRDILTEVLSINSLDSIKVRVTNDAIIAVPLCKPVEMKR